VKAGVAAGIAAAEGEDTEVAPKRKEKKSRIHRWMKMKNRAGVD
jgi:hypothetical protein